jgi:large subunit ribosomal protein L23
MASFLEKIGLKKKKRIGKKAVEIKNVEKDTKENRKKKEGNVKQVETDAKVVEKKVALKQKEVDSKRRKTQKRNNFDNAYQVLLGLLDTEKSSREASWGKYYFRVHPKSSKNRIKQAVEEYYKVEVTSVNIMNYKPKKKKFRLIEGSRSAYKKAVVTLKEGEVIK